MMCCPKIKKYYCICCGIHIRLFISPDKKKDWFKKDCFVVKPEARGISLKLTAFAFAAIWETNFFKQPW
jgi:hypothetical protein